MGGAGAPAPSGDAAPAPGTPKDWQNVGAAILGGAISPIASGSRRNRNFSRSPPEVSAGGQRLHDDEKPSDGGATKKSSFKLSLDLNDSADPSADGEDDGDDMPARENLVNKFAQEIMRSYPPELAAALGAPEVDLSSALSPRMRTNSDFAIDDLDTSSWEAPADYSEAEAQLNQSLRGIRASASRSFEAFRRSKVTAASSSSPNSSRGSNGTTTLKAESKELEQELIAALEAEKKELRVARQRLEVKNARLKAKNGAMMEQMRGLKEELEQAKNSDDKHRRDSSMGGGAMIPSIGEGVDSPKGLAPGVTSEEIGAKVKELETSVQEKALALKSVRKQFVDVLIKQQRAEKINIELQNDLEEQRKMQNEMEEQLTAANTELKNVREMLDERQRQLDDKTEEMQTALRDHDMEKASINEKHKKHVQDLLTEFELKLAAERQALESIKSEHANLAQQNTAEMNAQLVKEMGKMLKEAIEKSTKKSTQVETAMNNGSDVSVDTKDMFKCLTCSYINASIRLVCHNCGSKRFADLRNEKERKHIRKQWVQSLVNMYLNMLDEILKTPRGEKVVRGEAKHSNRSEGPISTDQIRKAEEKIQRMLQAAATQKGRQKFSEVYPKLESSEASESVDTETPPPRMKRHVRSVVNANKGVAGFGGSPASAKSTPTASNMHPPGTLVYAKWYGPEREKYPDWYEAEIAGVEADTYIVQYQNGTKCTGVPQTHVRSRRGR